MRLTERDEYGNAEIIALSDMMAELYMELSVSETNALTDALNKLAAYEDAEEQGRLLVLPCKLGDRLYWRNRYNEILEGEIIAFEQWREYMEGDFLVSVVGVDFKVRVDISSIGKTFFLTRKEAEKALEDKNERQTH